MRILIADDQEQYRTMFKTILGQFGSVDVAENGRKAFQMFCAALKSDTPYELLCIDLEMPSLNGLETIKMIRDIEKQASHNSMRLLICIWLCHSKKWFVDP